MARVRHFSLELLCGIKWQTIQFKQYRKVEEITPLAYSQWKSSLSMLIRAFLERSLKNL